MKRTLALLTLGSLVLGSIALGGSKMEQVPYLTEKPVRSFKAPQQVLKPNMDYYAEIKTTKGTMLIDLFEDKAPKTVNSFVFLALNHYFDGIIWHRVIPGFMAQTGDPTGTGTGGPGYQFGLELVSSLHYDKKGVLGMARTQDPNSNGSQFFITFAAAPHLNGQYTIWGQVKEGLEALDKITPTEGANKGKPDSIVSVRILVQPKK